MGIVVRYSGLDRGGAMERRASELVSELEAVYSPIARCDVHVEALRAAQRGARRYRVRVTIAVPGGEVVVSRDPDPAAMHEEPLDALNDSFDAARRRLEHYVWRNLGDDRLAGRDPARPG
jgi:Sigma 54 modulation protein / S30EA ribosomal protein